MRIVCGWCAHATPPDACDRCGRDPALPWLQRGQWPPRADGSHAPGRPPADPRDIRRRYDEARAYLEAHGRTPTVDAVAEQLDVSPRTVREWRKKYGL